MDGGGTCRYGSVVGIDALLRADMQAPSATPSTASTASTANTVDATLGACDECEQMPARVECDDCGLVYCAPCDAHRHRKGKLLFHQRQDLPTAGDDVRASDAQVTQMQQQTLQQSQHDAPATAGALAWSVEQVGEWLRAHDLELFLADVAAHSVDGAFLLSSRMDELLETHSSASRSLKRKLQREIQKLRSDQLDAAGSGSGSVTKASMRASLTSTAGSSSEPSQQQLPQSSSARRWGLNLRVNVNTSPAAAAAAAAAPPAPAVAVASDQSQSFSPVTALRSRIMHGQVDESKGRINRRRSAMATPSPLSPRALEPSALPSALRVSTDTAQDEPKRSKSVLFAPSQLRIDVSEKALLVAPSERLQQSPVHQQKHHASRGSWTQQHETRPSGRTDLRSLRQALGGLDLDILQVKKEERSVEASFDFSAEGRLQTQGFEINTHGIANVPFPHEHASKRAAMGTREYLVLLNELGHGAGGKVYKALYVPTFKLLAVKVIRVFDQKKRHQMVRELKSLYVNFVAINDTASRAACDELVVFYDAYTNPEIGSVSIVLEFMDRGSLEDHMQSGRRVSERELATMAHCVLKGLAFLHEHHQLHRDIKLSNMLMNHQGQVKISDFGISRDLESTLAKATTFTGTLLYMAPERISGGTYSYPSDIWSFGLAIMALAIGKLPVPTKEGYWGVVHAVQEQPSPRLADYGTHFSPALCDFIDQCLQKNPMLRPPAARLLEHAFIKENYSPRAAPAAAVTPQSDAADPMLHDKTLKELDHMAAQVHAWCVSHADTLLSPTAGGKDRGSLFQQRSNRARIESLAQQLHLPVATVAAKFAFLDGFCE